MIDGQKTPEPLPLSQEQAMTNRENPHNAHRVAVRWGTSAVVMVLLYALTGWPAAAFMGICVKHGWRRPFMVVSVLYYPHTYVMAWNRSYYYFIISGFETGDDTTSHSPSQSWEQYQDQQDDT